MEASDTQKAHHRSQLDYLEELFCQFQTSFPPTECDFQNEVSLGLHNVPLVPLNNGALRLVFDLETLKSSHLRKSIEFRSLLPRLCRKCNQVFSPNLPPRSPCCKWPRANGTRRSKAHASFGSKSSKEKKSKELSQFVEFRCCSLFPALRLGPFRVESYVRQWQISRRFLREKGERKEDKREEQIHYKRCYHETSWKLSKGDRKQIEGPSR